MYIHLAKHIVLVRMMTIEASKLALAVLNTTVVQSGKMLIDVGGSSYEEF